MSKIEQSVAPNHRNMTNPQTTDTVQRAKVWKRVAAVILDLFTIFTGVGYLIAWYTGEITPEGFNITGGPALVLAAVIAAYFFLGRRYAGGTLWDRIFGIRRPQPPD